MQVRQGVRPRARSGDAGGWPEGKAGRRSLQSHPIEACPDQSALRHSQREARRPEIAFPGHECDEDSAVAESIADEIVTRRGVTEFRPAFGAPIVDETGFAD
jgi:hypothetical protein